MKNKKAKWFIIVALLLIVAAGIYVKLKSKKPSDEVTKEINPGIGSIQTFISTTGTVLPKNRLEIKPPVNGRIESMLVKEGEHVKIGQILAWMSSTERAALIDAARGQGEEKLKYWQETYKPIPLTSPINGEVIVATTQSGQTVTSADAVVVLSDQLIVRAQVDETDIGKVKLDQKAILSLDAYPDTKINSKVEHMYYESKTVNNVTIYEVDLVPEDVPAFFRSGMNATINFIENEKDNILLIPLEALYKEKDESFVMVTEQGVAEPVKRVVKTGIADDKNTEVVSGLDKKDRVIVTTKKFALPKNNSGSSPFTPFGQRRTPAR